VLRTKCLPTKTANVIRWKEDFFAALSAYIHFVLKIN